MEKLIQRWVNLGLITQEKSLELLLDYEKEKEKSGKIKIQITLYVIGALLVGLGVILFIAANDWILKLLNMLPLIKILLVLLLSAGSFYGGYKLIYEKPYYPRMGKSLIFLSTLFVGGLYALISQMYNWNANNSGVMFLWAASIIPVAYIFKDKAVNILSIVLLSVGVVFYYMELAYDTGYTWTVFIPILLGVFLYSVANVPKIQQDYNDFSFSYKIVALASIFITLLILTCSVEETYKLVSINYMLPIAALLGLNLFNYFSSKNKTLLLTVETGYMVILLTLLFLLLILPVVSAAITMITANILIIIMITFGFNYGYKFENTRLVDLSTKLLVIYLITNYFRWAWSYFDKALFFILGGAVLFGIAIFLEKKKKELIGEGGKSND